MSFSKSAVPAATPRTVCKMSAVAPDCWLTEARITCDTDAMSRTTPAISSIEPDTSCAVVRTEVSTSEMVAVVSSDRVASRFTSSATTAKPHPASPARLA